MTGKESGTAGASTESQIATAQTRVRAVQAQPTPTRSRLCSASMADYPHPSSSAATAVMRANRRRDTGPEIRLRAALHARGLRFRADLLVEAGGVRVRPDVVFTRRKVAVFVDGCFWHCCPDHGNTPKANRAYWSPKLARNRARDQRVNSALLEAGWVVLRVWEHDDAQEAADWIERACRQEASEMKDQRRQRGAVARFSRRRSAARSLAASRKLG
jgi:DNA mismatch endonuclease (patch repair protein)